MMKIKTLLQYCRRTALLLLALLATANMALAYNFEEGSIYYNISGSTATVTYATTDYNSYSGDVVIPETVTHDDVTYTVTKIGDYAFYNCTGLTSVEIPLTVTAIGTINQPGRSFANCTSLTSIVIPDNVGFIGILTFSGCSGLKNVTIGKSISKLKMNKSGRPYYAFQDCNSITSLTWNAVYCADNGNMGTANIEHVVIGPEVTMVPDNFVKESKITEVAIPNSLGKIGSSAFLNCYDLENVTLGESLTTIGSSAFQSCGIERIDIPNSVISIGNGAFSGCNNMSKVTIGNSVTTIGDEAFRGCIGIEEITIPNSVTSIGNSAFKKCYSLSEVAIGNAVTTIGEQAFDCCENLTKVNISSVEAWCGIQFNYVFSNPLYYAHHLYLNDQEITDLVIPNSVTAINNYAFYGCSGFTSVTIGDSVVTIGDYAFRECTGMTDLTLGNSLIGIFPDAFSYCTGLKNITMGSSLTGIGDGAFSGCTSLTSFTLGKSVTEQIFGNVIEYCPNITSLSVESGNPVYDSRDNCNAIIETATNKLIMGCQNTVIPRTVTSISSDAFSGCENLTSIFIPNTVTSIGLDSIVDVNNDITYYKNNPFQACSGLKSIIVESGNPVYDSRDNCNAIIETATNTLRVGCQSTTIPATITSIGDYAFSECTSLKSIDIPNSVTTIGDYAFFICTALSSINIPNSVTNIGSLAFWACSSLMSLDIPSSVTAIEGYAFAFCTSLTNAVIPNSVICNYETLNDNDPYGSYGWFRGCSSLTSVTIGQSIEVLSMAFWECPNITRVTCLNENPPIMRVSNNNHCFEDVVFNQATLYVPASSLEAYQTEYDWNKFQDIRPLGDADTDGEVGIGDVTRLIDYLLSDNVNGFDMGAADTDGDGQISIGDVTKLIDTVLHQ